MKVLAYARGIKGRSAADQVTGAEAWARARRADVRRLAGHELRPDSIEYPPRTALVSACEHGLVDGIVVADLAALGPDVTQSLRRLDRLSVRLLIAGDESGGGGRDLDSSGIQLAVAVAQAVAHGATERAPRPRRVCPPRILIDLDEVRTLRQRGYRLVDIAQQLGCGRTALVTRLRREREESGDRR